MQLLPVFPIQFSLNRICVFHRAALPRRARSDAPGIKDVVAAVIDVINAIEVDASIARVVLINGPVLICNPFPLHDNEPTFLPSFQKGSCPSSSSSSA